MKITIAFFSLALAFFTTTSLAQDWTSLDRYQETMSRKEAKEIFSEFMVGHHAEDYATTYFKFTQNSLLVQDGNGNLEYEFRFGSRKLEKNLVWNGRDFKGLKFAIVARDKASVKVALTLEELLIEGGAQADGIKVQTNSNEAATDINNSINKFAAHVTLVIQDVNVGNAFIAFAPGAFLENELETPAYRFRFLHSMVSRKTIQSIDFGRKLAQTFIAGGSPKRHIAANDYQGNIRQVSSQEGSGVETNLAIRNLFINGVLSPVVVWAFTGSSRAHLGTDADKIAGLYLKSINEYVATFDLEANKEEL
jgi:hypothetical protein